MLIITIAFFLFKVSFSSFVAVSVDECYYWDWAKNPQMSYLDHPPMIGYLIALTTSFSDASAFVRLPVALLSFGVSFLLYFLSLRLFASPFAALATVLLSNLCLLFFIGGIIATPDTPLLFFWSLFMLLFLRSVRENSPALWIGAGVALGFALLSKYTAVFLLPCAMIYLVWDREYRSLFFKAGPFLMAFTAFLLFLPVLVWNVENGLVSFFKQAQHGFSNHSSLWYRFAPEFLGSQIGLVTPFLFAAMSLSAWYGFRFFRGSSAWKFCLSFSLPVFFFFMAKSFTQRIEGNWAAMAYIGLFLLVPVFYTALKEGRVRIPLLERVYPVCFWGSAVSGILLIGLVLSHALYPYLPLPVKLDVTKRLHGAESLAVTVDLQRDKVKIRTGKDPFVFALTHQYASSLYYHLKGHPRTYETFPHRRYSYITEYPEKGSTGLYVVEMKRNWSVQQIVPYFSSVKKVAEKRIVRGGKEIWSYNIYLCVDYHGGLFEKSN